MEIENKALLYGEWAARQEETYKGWERFPIPYFHKTHLTGTMASALLGLNKWKTPADLYNEFYAEPSDLPGNGNAFMRVGACLEDLVVDLYAERTRHKVKHGRVFVDQMMPWCGVQVDAWDERIGCPLEIKTAGMPRDEWGKGSVIDTEGDTKYPEGKVPAEYVIQCNDQMWMTGKNHMRLCCLFRLDCSIRIYDLNYDPELQSRILKAKEDFLFNCLIPHRPPVQPLSERAGLDLKAEKYAVADVKFMQMLKELDEAKAASKAQAEKASEIEANLTRIMAQANARQAVDQYGYIVAKLTPCKPRVTFDSKLFKEKNPDMYCEFLKSTEIKPRFTYSLPREEN